jgi:membrane protein required for colicin V production
MNYLDVLIAIPLVWGAYKGFQRGLIFELAMLIGIVLGLYLAFKLSGLFEALVAKMTDATGSTLYVVTFLVVFISVVLIMILLGKLLEQVLKIGKMDNLNKAAGSAFGLLKFLLVVSTVLSVFRPVDAKFEILPAKIKSESILYQPVTKCAQYLFPALEDVKEEFSKHVG